MPLQTTTANVVMVLVGCLLASCGAKSADKVDQSPKAPHQPIEGYHGFKFGSSVREALTEVGTRFDAESVNNCFKDLPLKGCDLSWDPDSAPYEIRNGIPYALSLSFNKFDKLTDIDLSYDREGDISQRECLDLHERTLDWLVADYGTFAGSSVDPGHLAKQHRTPTGNPYLVVPEDGGSLITAPMRTVPKSSAPRPDQPIAREDNERYVWILTTYLVVNGKPKCGIHVTFSEPPTIERRKIAS